MRGDPSFASLRVTVEAQIDLPAIILVGAATERDGAHRVAHGLAAAFVEAGRRAILVETSPDPSYEPDPDTVGITMIRIAGVRDIGARLDALRSDREVVLIAAAPLLSSPQALEIGRRADGVVLAVRMGRAIRAEDEQIPGMLARIGA